MRLNRLRSLGLVTITALAFWALCSPVCAQNDSAESGHPQDQFGKQLAIVGDLGVGRSMDAAVEGNRLYVISGRTLNVCDISDPASPNVVGKLTGLGNLRQIEVQDGVAYITARADGLFIVDVKQATKPQLLCHYDTIEVATGIAVAGRLAFVACRSCGVEVVDVSNPREPVHLSTVRTGEAQSVVARGRFLYTGVWGSSQLVVTDIANPRRPRITAKLPLDGYGDGVDVRGNFCFVATGHHSKERPRRQEGDPGFGRGHGLEIFDLTDPAKPVFVSRIKTPPLYALGMDMWSVTVAGRYAFLSDTYNGLFVVDIADHKHPRFVAHRQLSFVKSRKHFSPVGGFALARDHIYVAGAWSGLHTLAASGLATIPQTERHASPVVPRRRPESDPRYRVYKPIGQVHAVAFADDKAIVAAGRSGMHVVQLWPKIDKLAEYKIDGFAMDVKVFGDHVYLAEGNGGLSIWKRDGTAALRRVGRYDGKGTVRQVVVPPPGKYALLQVGAGSFQVVDVTDPRKPVLVFKDSRLGMMYGHPITERLLDGRYVSCFWHVTGHFWYDLYGGPKPVFAGDNFPLRTGALNGMALLEKNWLLTYRGKYFLLDRKETRAPGELPLFGVKGHDLSGEPSIYGKTLYVSNRITGKVSAVDISEIEKPKLLDSLQVREHPGLVVEHRGVPVIPAGFQGLLVWEPSHTRTNHTKEQP